MTRQIETTILIVGTGGNAIAAASMLQRAGLDDLIIIGKHGDFGGAWYQNKYPGCGTDAEIALYQLGFALSYDWKGTHPNSDEVEEYLQSVARDNGLYEKTHFDTELLEARWREDEARWEVATNGPTYLADFVYLITGFLEEPIEPELPGRETFAGRIFHSSEWPSGYTGEGDRIAVVGAGSSALQIVPAMQRVAREVISFKRTPNWVGPKGERRLSEEEIQELKDDPGIIHQRRQELLAWGEGFWTSVILGQDPEGAKQVEEAALASLEEQVPDPELRALLTPAHPIGCKRPGSSDDWYSALQQPNVTVLREGAASLGERTIRSSGGREFEVDTVVLATGFYFGGHIRHRIVRRDGVTAGEYQGDHPRSYKGMSISGCPNLFFGGPGPNGQIWDGLANGEVTSRYVIEAIKYYREHGIRAMEVDEAAELQWKAEADAVLAAGASLSGACTNYSQDESGGNKAAWPGNLAHMQEVLSVFDPTAYTVVAEVPAAVSAG